MTSSEAGCQKDAWEDLKSGRLLRDIEEISKALYLHRNAPKVFISPSSQQSTSLVDDHPNSSVIHDELLPKHKKSSIWSWKPLKALTHIHHHQFHCCFFLHVHEIEGLPPKFNDLSISVHWKRKDEVLESRPARVCHGTAKFEETLMHRCSVYGSRNGTQKSAKYEPKLYLLSASVVGTPTIDIGKHWVDVTRLLPLTLEELEEEKRTSGKWTTSFKLTGKAKGAQMNVSFGFSLLQDKSMETSCFVKVPHDMIGNRLDSSEHFEDCGRVSTDSVLRRLSSGSRNPSIRSHASSESTDFRSVDEISPNKGPELARSVSFFYKKIEQGKLGSSSEYDLAKQESRDVASISGSIEHEFKVNQLENDFSLKELFKREQDANWSAASSEIEMVDVFEIFKDIETAFEMSEGFKYTPKLDDRDIDEGVKNEGRHAENDMCSKAASIEELESAIHNLLTSEAATISSSLGVGKFVSEESNCRRMTSLKGGKLVRSLSLDRLTESVANDFLNMLGNEQFELDMTSDNGPESPRESLLLQFEQESPLSGNSIFDFSTTKELTKFTDFAPSSCGRTACFDNFQLPLLMKEAEEKNVAHSIRSRRNLDMLEKFETEALMKKWGLEEDFHNSPHISSGGFGSPIHPTLEVPPDLPSLGENLGPVIQTRDGGFLRSMNPFLFSSMKNGARLVTQISRSVVLPAVMGSDIMEILECWASVGVENMCSQVSELMPLEDITGKTIQQVMGESDRTSELLQRLTLPRELVTGNDLLGTPEREKRCFRWASDNRDLTLGYRDSNSDYASPKDLVRMTMAKVDVLSVEGLKIHSGMSDEGAPWSIRLPSNRNLTSSGKSGSSFSEEAVSMQYMDVDEIVKLSLPLDEWIKIDDGDFALEGETNVQIGKIIAAQQSKPVKKRSGNCKTDVGQWRVLDRKKGTFGKNLTIMQRLQLRDPFRNYERVGGSMLVLIQVERIHKPLHREEDVTVPESNSNEQKSDLNESANSPQDFPMFKICEIHVAGLNVEPGDKLTLTSNRQQQSGIRWLLSSGMGRSISKNPASRSKAITTASIPLVKKVQSGGILWSISSKFQDAEMNVRNPDFVFPDISVRSEK